MVLTMVPSPNHNDTMVSMSGGKSPRIRGWLTGLGLGSSPVSSPSSRRCSAHSTRGEGREIADDIRNDQDLFFADDDLSGEATDDGPHLPPLSLPPTTAFCQGSHQHQRAYTGPIISQRRRSSTATATSSAIPSTSLPRRSSQQKMVNLQREVDRALEFFHAETENELDDCYMDGDDYLNMHMHTEKYQRVENHCHDQVTGCVNTEGGTQQNACHKFGRMNSCECDDSLPGTAATSMATSVVTDYDTEFGDCQFTKLLSLSEQSSSVSATEGGEPQTPRMSGSSGPTDTTGLSLKHKTKSIISLPLSLLSQSAHNCADMEEDTDEPSVKFDDVMSHELNRICLSEQQKNNVDFNVGQVRNAMEPYLAVARIRREEARQNVFDTLDKVMLPQDEPHDYASRRASTSSDLGFHIGSTYGVPYPALRNESSFLYDVESFPLAQVLAETLGVQDLSKIHLECPLKKDKGRLLASLQNRGRRRKFHQCFDNFVTSQVIPLLHSQALSKGVFYTNRHQLQKGKAQSIIYRYQAFPSINIVRPGECSTDPHCDMAQGHSIGNISYHIPLTATFGTNAVYTESRPGREDWHPLCTKSPGLGFQFDGARCLHFNLKNETDITRVSLNFRIAITRAPCVDDIAYDPDDQLCCLELLKDQFSAENPGFFDEVVVNVGDVPRSFMPGPVAVKRRGRGSISVVG